MHSISLYLSMLCLLTCVEIIGAVEQVPEKQNGENSEVAVKKFPHGYPETKPDTIEKAIDILKVVLTDEQKAEIKGVKKDALINYHFSLGMWIRNNFGLWGKNTVLLKLLGGGDPDGASMLLIEKLWEKLQE